MEPIYAELSRRALIKLNNDFDKDNDDALKSYLADALEADEAAYEKVRPVEMAIEAVDNGTEIAESVIEDVSKLFGSLKDKLCPEKIVSECE